jgi:hypothetical protein
MPAKLLAGARVGHLAGIYDERYRKQHGSVPFRYQLSVRDAGVNAASDDLY